MPTNGSHSWWGLPFNPYTDNASLMVWQCKEGHTWQSDACHVRRGQWCPFCAGRRHDIEYVRSVAAPHGGTVCDTEFCGNKHKYQWRCSKGHEWSACLSNVISRNQWCPHCAGNARIDLHDVKQIVRSKGGECLVFSGINTTSRVQVRCGCGYVWWITPKNLKKGRWCPKCSGRLPPRVEVAQEIAKSRGGACLSHQVLRSSDVLEWKCRRSHTWFATWANVKNKKSWCPHCREYRREQECRAIFESLFVKPFPKRKSIFGTRLELDGYCEELGLAFEYNGEQHYRCCKGFSMTAADLKTVQERDGRKANLCRKHGIDLIVIPYTESKHLEQYIKGRCSNRLLA